MSDEKSRGNVLAITSALFQASVAVFWAYLLVRLARPVLMVYWFGIAFIILTIFLLSIKKFKFDFKNIPLLPIIIFGFLSFLTTFLIMMGVASIGASLTSFIMQTSIIFALFYSVFGLKEKFKKSEMIGILLILIGLLVLSWRAELSFTISSLLIVLAALSHSTNHFFAKKLLKKIPKLQLNLIRISFILIFSIIYLIIAGISLEPISLKVLSILILGVIVGPIFIYVFYYSALQKTNLATANALKSISPIFTFILAFIFLGEILTLQQTISVAIMLLGAYSLIKK